MNPEVGPYYPYIIIYQNEEWCIAHCSDLDNVLFHHPNHKIIIRMAQRLKQSEDHESNTITAAPKRINIPRG